VLIMLGSASHPMHVLLPWILTSLLSPWPEVVRTRMLQAAAASAVTWGLKGMTGSNVRADDLGAILGFIALIGLGVHRAPRWLAWTLAMALVLVRFGGYDAWTPLALILVAAALARR
jgi:hypothetical protein